MTNENYTQMSNQELVEFVDELHIYNGRLNIVLKTKYPEIHNEILNRTQFLSGLKCKSIPFPARLYCLKHNLNDIPKCQNPSCNNKVTWRNGINEFGKHCSCKCSMNDPQNKELHKTTNLKLYGVENPFQYEPFKEKIKQTNLSRRGVEYSMQDAEVKEKAKQTSLKHFGVEYPNQAEEVRLKTKHTCQIKYGVDCIFSSSEFQKKLQSVWLEHLGVRNPFQADTVKNKIKQTIQKLYGVDHYSQTHEFQQKTHRRYTNPKYPDITFATSWEFKVYDFLTEHNIPFEYQVEPIPYEYDGVIHYYFPDFRVNGRIYEVKGDNFFRINEQTGQEEMYLTWRGGLSDEEYEWRCGREEAKHQCMIANNVFILRHDHIKNLSIHMFT